MNDIYDFLNPQEKLTLDLRRLYEDNGFTKFKVAKFEAYDFYASNRDFLIGGNIVPFTDPNGRLLALKPDVTLSIVKNIEYNDNTPKRMYYTENVYREAKDIHELREIFQLGVEAVGSVDLDDTSDLISLAVKSLMMIDESCVVSVSHMGYLEGLLNHITDNKNIRKQILSLMGGKNAHELRQLAIRNELSAQYIEIACELCSGSAPGEDLASRYVLDDTMKQAADELIFTCDKLRSDGCADKIKIDFSQSKTPSYYNGIIIEGYVSGVAKAVLSGGRYDSLLKRMGKGNVSAFGFALYFDAIERKLMTGGVSHD